MSEQSALFDEDPAPARAPMTCMWPVTGGVCGATDHVASGHQAWARERAEQRTHEIVERVGEMTPTEIRQMLVDAIEQVALAQPTVFVDDVWDRVPEGMRAEIGSRIGPAMLAAFRSGWIEKTGEFRETVSHGRTHSAQPVWRSLLYR